MPHCRKSANSSTPTLNDHHVPGAAVAIVSDQDLAWAEGFGLADIASKRAMTPDTLFGVASISKTFTGAAIVQLRDEGKLSLDDPLVKFIPEFNAVTCHYGRIEDVTLRRLLTHLSGLVGESPTAHWRSAEFPTMREILDGAREVGAGHRTAFSIQVFEPRICAAGRGRRARFRASICRISSAQEILDPLGMTSSCFTMEEAGEKMATGYLPHPYEDVPEAGTSRHRSQRLRCGRRTAILGQ